MFKIDFDKLEKLGKEIRELTELERKYMTEQDEISELIRDITQAGFMPKSEARRRIEKMQEESYRKGVEDCLEEISLVYTEEKGIHQWLSLKPHIRKTLLDN